MTKWSAADVDDAHAHEKYQLGVNSRRTAVSRAEELNLV